MQILNTIVPIFVVIMTGLVLRRQNFLPASVLGPLNRLVFYLAIPAMIFHKVASAAWETHFQPILVLTTLVPVLVVFVLVLALSPFTPVSHQDRGSFLQCAVHGNLGYIGLAVCFYALGDEGLTRASILAGFLMLVQNILSVLSLILSQGKGGQPWSLGFLATKIVVNPVILSALAGLFFSLADLRLPLLLARSLEIVSGMALPLALLVIGASLSFGLLRLHLLPALIAGGIKLVILPCLGLVGAVLLTGLDLQVFAPALLLLAAPTATVSVVMAREMHGAPDLASAAVALNTLLSAVSYTLWLSLL